MRVTTDYRNSSNLYAPEFNHEAPWPTYYPGQSWEKYVPVYQWGLYSLDYWTMSLYASAMYMAAILVGKAVMHYRKPFDLKWPLVAWNASLALFSLLGTYQLLPYMIYTIWTQGHTEYVCEPPVYRRRELMLWLLLFGWSKILEFGDTAFLVLRKRPVIPLHWVHHALTCTICFWSGQYLPVHVIQQATINYAVHSYMYAYYAARAAGYQIPLSWTKWITRTQIAQMIFNFISLVKVYYVMEWTPRPCHNHPTFVYVSLGLFGLFTFMFVNFFIQNYYGRSGKKSTGGMKFKLNASEDEDQQATSSSSEDEIKQEKRRNKADKAAADAELRRRNETKARGERAKVELDALELHGNTPAWNPMKILMACKYD